MSYHPWRDARARLHLTIRFTGERECQRRGSLSANTVELSADQTQAERRCTLAHELVHDERRVFPRDPALRSREEVAVETIAARRLIALDRLVDVLRWTRQSDELADELWVDLPMLVALVRSLTDDERAWINNQIEDAA